MGKIGLVVAEIFNFYFLRSSFIFPLEVIFIWYCCIIWFGHISLSLKFSEDRTSGCWDISFWIFEVFFHFSIGGCLHLTHIYNLFWSHKLNSKIWWRLGQWLLRYSVFNFWGLLSFSIWGCHHLKHYYSLVWSHKFECKIQGRSDQWLLRYSILIIWGLLSFFQWRFSS